VAEKGSALILKIVKKLWERKLEALGRESTLLRRGKKVPEKRK